MSKNTDGFLGRSPSLVFGGPGSKFLSRLDASKTFGAPPKCQSYESRRNVNCQGVATSLVWRRIVYFSPRYSDLYSSRLQGKVDTTIMIRSDPANFFILILKNIREFLQCFRARMVLAAGACANTHQ